MSLFREEALEAQSKTGMGEVIITQPRIFWMMSAFFTVLAAAIATYAVIGEFSRKETVSGYLAPSDGIAAVYAQRGGVISEVLIAEGDYVEAGQILARLTTDSAAQSGEGALLAQIGQTDSRLTELRLQLDVSQRQYEAEALRLADRVQALADELVQLHARLALSRESEALAREQWERWRDMGARGLAPAVEVDARRQALINAQSAHAETTRLISEREGQRRDAQHALDLLPTQRDLALSRLRGEIVSLEQTRSELQRSSGYALTAPVSGRVSMVQATRGAFAPPNQPLAAILPDGGALRAHLLAPTRSAGFVGRGQAVNLRIDAFPYQRFGAVRGQISNIAATILAPGELAAPVAVQEPVYRLMVELERETIAAYGVDQPLQAGMTLQADILVDRRPLWRWFIDPVIAARRN